MADYAVELTVEFDGGTGITRSASREAFRFRTDVPVVPGQRLNGTLSEVGEGDSPATTLSYSAVVTVARPHADTGMFEVEARFLQLDFVTPQRPKRRTAPSLS